MSINFITSNKQEEGQNEEAVEDIRLTERETKRSKYSRYLLYNQRYNIILLAILLILIELLPIKSLGSIIETSQSDSSNRQRTFSLQSPYLSSPSSSSSTRRISKTVQEIGVRRKLEGSLSEGEEATNCKQTRRESLLRPREGEAKRGKESTCADCLSSPESSFDLIDSAAAKVARKARERYGYEIDRGGIEGYNSIEPRRPNEKRDYYATSAGSFEGIHERSSTFAPPPNDHKCPMRGPVTVCEQVEAYPADAILARVQQAKKLAKASYFNIDSLFSDEREHSLEPFESSLPIVGGSHIRARLRNGSQPLRFRSNLNAHKLSGLNVTSMRNTPQSLYNEHASNVRLKSQPLSATTTTTTTKTTSKKMMTTGTSRGSSERSEQQAYKKAATSQFDYNNNNDNFKYNDHKQTTRRPIRSYANHRQQQFLGDQFVDLVERQAIRLSGSESYELDNRRKLLEKSQRTLSHSGGGWLPAGRLVGAYNNEEQGQLFGQVGGIHPAAASGGRPKRQAAEPNSMLLPEEESNFVGGGADNRFADGSPTESSAGEEPLNEVTEPACRARSIYISPRAALNDKKQWKYVVNAPERDPQIRQIIRVDVCEDPFGPCSSQISIPFGFSSQCKQKYSKKKLLAVDDQSGFLSVDTFFIPTCCVCQLVRDRASLDEASNDGASASAILDEPGGSLNFGTAPPPPDLANGSDNRTSSGPFSNDDDDKNENEENSSNLGPASVTLSSSRSLAKTSPPGGRRRAVLTTGSGANREPQLLWQIPQTAKTTMMKTTIAKAAS